MLGGLNRGDVSGETCESIPEVNPRFAKYPPALTVARTIVLRPLRLHAQENMLIHSGELFSHLFFC